MQEMLNNISYIKPIYENKQGFIDTLNIIELKLWCNLSCLFQMYNLMKTDAANKITVETNSPNITKNINLIEYTAWIKKKKKKHVSEYCKIDNTYTYKLDTL